MTIFGIVWQSAKAVFTRMLDGVEAGVIGEMRHAAEHVAGMTLVAARARWLGHKLHADVEITVDERMPLAEANAIAASFRQALFAHVPALAVANVSFAAGAQRALDRPHHHH